MNSFHSRFRNLLTITVFVVLISEFYADIIPPGFEEVTKEPMGGRGPIYQCGEGDDKGIRTCVRYDNCDPKTNTIISSENYDGTGLIDIRYRFGSNKCEHPLDVCCDIPKGGIPPNVKLPNTSDIGGGQETSTSSPPVQPDTLSYCGIRNENGIDFKITGNFNNEAEFGEFPWMTAVLSRNAKPTSKDPLAVCGGSLITPTVVLTGAHCVANFTASELKVRVGEWDTQTTRERLPYQERGIAQIISHEGFMANNLFNDVALLILESPIDKNQHIGTICLPPQNLQFQSKECFATGWGKDVFGKQGQYQVILKKIQLPIVPRATCQQLLRQTRLGPAFTLHSSFICAGGESGKDTCTGDGGGPLVCPDPTNPLRYVQTGIVAWGIGCGENGVPGVYADVSQFRSWIDGQLKRLNIDTQPYLN